MTLFTRIQQISFISMALLIAIPAFGAPEYSRYFREGTMRVDYYHTGTKGEEQYSLDQVYEEGPWPGSKVNLLDTLNLGEYMVRVYDQSTAALIYSRGFSTIFNEWQTTDEAGTGAFRTFSETVRFPFPRRAIQLTISRRDKRMVFHEVFSVLLDPNDPSVVAKRKLNDAFPVMEILNNGAPATKVDILILGDGYAAEDAEKLRADARHFTDVLFSTYPFSARKNDFNVRLVNVVSSQSGIDIPDQGLWRGNALGSHYSTFGSARYVLTTENKTLRNIAAAAPYDFLCILINDSRYGGGGIFQLYTTTYTGEKVAGQEWQMDYVYVHEFGHSFAGLGDEYYTSSTGYNDFYMPGVEPWEPNITALTNTQTLKWAALLTSGIELPTSWEKVSYDSLEAIRGKLDRLAPDYYEKRQPLYRAGMRLLRESRQAGKVGAFEGAGYASKGLYRPSIDCRMFSLSLVDFDLVCSAAIMRMIDFYAR